MRMDKDGPTKDDISTYYKSLGVECSKRYYHELLDLMGEHTWNLVGNWWNKTPEGNVWNYALPNKLFDGIAAGVPPVVIGCPEAAELVLEHDIGIVIKHPKDLVKRWGENVEKRRNLLLYRDKYALENYMQELVKLYERIVK
jgi:glycosyltransferase involved in cell wall biosynthesis